MKKAYTPPRLIVHGSVEKITLARHHNHRNHNANNNANDPNNSCAQGNASFCS
jgi:hypothetical protein